jgi:hypothetical protein
VLLRCSLQDAGESADSTRQAAQAALARSDLVAAAAERAQLERCAQQP